MAWNFPDVSATQSNQRELSSHSDWHFHSTTAKDKKKHKNEKQHKNTTETTTTNIEKKKDTMSAGDCIELCFACCECAVMLTRCFRMCAGPRYSATVVTTMPYNSVNTDPHCHSHSSSHIPFSDGPKIVDAGPKNPEIPHVKHVINPGETVQGIMIKYNVTVCVFFFPLVSWLVVCADLVCCLLW